MVIGFSFCGFGLDFVFLHSLLDYGQTEVGGVI